jgi:hypothetical protein
VPLAWATSFGNQGLTVMHLAERIKDEAMAETALLQIKVAFETLREGGHAPFAAFMRRVYQTPAAFATHSKALETNVAVTIAHRLARYRLPRFQHRLHRRGREPIASLVKIT